MNRYILFLLSIFASITIEAAVGDTFYATVAQPNGNTRMMFTDLGGGKAALGNGYSACLDYRYSGTINIPATVTYNAATYTVAQVNKFAFYLCNQITEVSFKGSLDKIDDFAFYGCRKLTVTNKTTKDACAVKGLRNGAFALTDLKTFWIDDASQCDKGIFRGCNNMKWVVFDGSDANATFTKYDRSDFDSRTDGLPKSTVVYMPKGINWRADYDASRTSLTPTDDDWAHANYVYVDPSSGERKSQFVAFGYSVPKLGVTAAATSFDLPLDFTASLIYISRGASSSRVQTINVPTEIPMERYNASADYKDSKAYAFEGYDASTGTVTFHKAATLPAGTPGLLVDFSNDVIANTNAKIQAFGPSAYDTGLANSDLDYANWLAESKGQTAPNGVMIGYYDRQRVPLGSWAYAGSGNTTGDGKAISEGTFFHITKDTWSAPMRAVLWLGSDSQAKSNSLIAKFVDDEGTATLIKGVADYKKSSSEDWFNLSGEKLEGKPTKQGVYIHDGRKVIVR